MPSNALMNVVNGICPVNWFGIIAFAMPAIKAPNPAHEVKIPRPIAPLLKIPSAMTGRISKVPLIMNANKVVNKMIRRIKGFLAI